MEIMAPGSIQKDKAPPWPRGTARPPSARVVSPLRSASPFRVAIRRTSSLERRQHADALALAPAATGGSGQVADGCGTKRKRAEAPERRGTSRNGGGEGARLVLDPGIPAAYGRRWAAGRRPNFVARPDGGRMPQNWSGGKRASETDAPAESARPKLLIFWRHGQLVKVWCWRKQAKAGGKLRNHEKAGNG